MGEGQNQGWAITARQRHELLLIAARGSVPVPTPESRPDSVIEAPRTEHSAKPEAIYTVIERMYPEFPRLEMFARQQREGWQTWGIKMEHEFTDEREFSEAASSEPFWDAVYRQAFPNLVSHMPCPGDFASQRMGIDRVLLLSNGKTLTIDEKKRREVVSRYSTGIHIR